MVPSPAPGAWSAEAMLVGRRDRGAVNKRNSLAPAHAPLALLTATPTFTYSV